MNPKYLLALSSVLLILLQAPTAESCVNFQAYWDAPSGPGSSSISAQLWDNGADPVCSASSVYVDSNGPDPFLRLNCIAGFSATFDTVHSYDMSYSTPAGSYVFDVDWVEEQQMWYICEFCDSASECFVPTRS